MIFFLRALRTSKVLDDRKPGSVRRDQSVVHALLKDASGAPMQESPEGLRRRIAARIEDAGVRGETPRGSDALVRMPMRVWIVRGVSIAACAAVVCVVGAYWSGLIGAHVQSGAGLAGADLGASAGTARVMTVALPSAPTWVEPVRPRRVDMATAASLSAQEQRAIEETMTQVAGRVLSGLPVRSDRDAQ